MNLIPVFALPLALFWSSPTHEKYNSVISLLHYVHQLVVNFVCLLFGAGHMAHVILLSGFVTTSEPFHITHGLNSGFEPLVQL